jgi:hypothetical protein
VKIENEKPITLNTDLEIWIVYCTRKKKYGWYNCFMIESYLEPLALKIKLLLLSVTVTETKY